MLPILSGQPHRHYARLDAADLTRLAADATPVFVEEKDISAFQGTLTASGHSARPLGSYRSLATHGSGLRFARVGATAADWRAAFDQRSLAPLMTTVTWFEITPR